MPRRGIIHDMYAALEEAGFSFVDATLIGVRTFALPKEHQETIRKGIISKCRAKTLRPDTDDGQKLIKLAKKHLE